MLDSILNRYHWTYDYLLWEVSWLNLTLMLRDVIYYDSEATDDSDTIYADEINNTDLLNTLFNTY